MDYPSDFINKIICGDFLDLARDMPDNSIDLIVTSPPYNVKKGYDVYDDDQEFEDYHLWLRSVCREMFRLVKPNSNIFVNISDIGISNGEARGKHRIGERGNFYVVPNHIVVIDEMIREGAQYLNPIIWKKPSNHTSQFGANARFCGTFPYPKNCHIPSQLEYILRFRKNGRYEKVERERKEKSIVTKERWLELSDQLWTFHGVTSKKRDHPTPFPLELPLRCIEGWSFIEDIVLDPFMGTGTTAEAAKNLGRNYVGFDISQEYCDLAMSRLESNNGES